MSQFKFSDAQVTKFKKIFDSADKDKSSSIDKKEFKRLLKKLDSEISIKCLDLVIRLLDDNGNDVLEYDEFLHFMYVAYNTTDEYDVFFFGADMDQSGLISETEFRNIIKKLKLPASEENVKDAIFDVQGFDSEMRMTYEQFKSFVSKFIQ